MNLVEKMELMTANLLGWMKEMPLVATKAESSVMTLAEKLVDMMVGTKAENLGKKIAEMMVLLMVADLGWYWVEMKVQLMVYKWAENLGQPKVGYLVVMSETLVIMLDEGLEQ